MKSKAELEKTIEYTFKNDSLLTLALTHSSYAHEHHLGDGTENERLEYLGDAVLELMTSEYLYRHYPTYREGELTRIRSALVCEDSLSEIAITIGLGDFIFMTRGEEKTGGRNRKSLLSDAFEALIGAIYLDGGFEAVSKFVDKFVLVNTEDRALYHDAKSLLQEETQGRGLGRATYEIINQTGPDHAKVFTVAVYVNGEMLGTGVGNTKKDAEKKASYEALLRLKGM